MEFFDTLKKITDPQEAIQTLGTLTQITSKVHNALDIATKYHAGQKRKSGEPYVVHPICVACIVAFYGGDEAMICSALLHDVVEDTLCDIDVIKREFGNDVAILVDALTKITEIRKEELVSNHSSQRLIISALSFRKMLVAAVKDPRALVIKISDRLHNMLTLEVLPYEKQIRISEETLVVYAPVAHRLGISSIKNELEDKSFHYIFPQEYEKIHNYLKENRQSLSLRLNHFIDKLNKMILNMGFSDSDFRIESRVKRPYSIYLKMQRKGVSVDEILDLLAVRIIVKNPIDCYKVLGIVHLNFKPIVSRFKDYIALPKENGYQTIHTTIFDEALVYEIQIRTFDMHKSAEYGIAAHWKYKTGGMIPSLEWLHNLQYQNNTIEEFYELAKNDLYQEDIVVFSPDGDTYALPVGAVALDFAYAVHSELGDNAKEAYVNNQKVSLLQTLRSGDIVRIVSGEQSVPKCTWVDAVKTSRAKSHLRLQRQNQIREIERKSAVNILATIFGKNHKTFERYLSIKGFDNSLFKVTKDIGFLQDLKNKIKQSFNTESSFFAKIRMNLLKLKKIELENFVIYTNRNVNEVLFDYCCHPKYGDEILAIITGQKAVVHHKLCEKLSEDIDSGIPMVFVEWAKKIKTAYKVIVALEDKKGTLANFLTTLAKNGCNVIGVSYLGYKSQFSTHCEILFEADLKDIKPFKELMMRKYKVIEFSSLKDAYQS
ncbi:penta-phosphate guanosine-3'-pyrophosphohydrolase [Helicobacter sp. 12S02232-10]|uniref:RelA/SpoT family protein n=1 Tax=Helicobacter sp. 12S02232-10 TaxID=1476197 RepID=UPI000BA67BB6|nr:RelA/SpoT family protein [Helicobacter sp. 12S02232-10]PAF48242.1 penta-phosphate guanosine-3'-pyrophosphohydrolase [Helicobacter sp. 12S02232-10]